MATPSDPSVPSSSGSRRGRPQPGPGPGATSWRSSAAGAAGAGGPTSVTSPAGTNEGPQSTSRLGRRWSLDNLAGGGRGVDFEGKQAGSIKDLRRHHQQLHHQMSSGLSSIRDEEYPLMLTEQQSGAAAAGGSALSAEGGGDGAANAAAEKRASPGVLATTRIGSAKAAKGGGHHPAARLFASRLHHYPTHHAYSAASCSFSGAASPVAVFQFSSSVDISVVPEENELSPSPAVTASAAATRRGVLRPSSALASATAVAVSSPLSASPPSPAAPVAAPSSRLSIETKIGERKAFLRQRSSSLPRILPPILDDGALGAAQTGVGDSSQRQVLRARHPMALVSLNFFQVDRQSNVVVREMQKFVCRQATDVSQLLPIPIPSNSRQERNLSIRLQQQQQQSKSERRGPDALDSDGWEQQHCVMSSMGRIHGILFAVKQTSPALYAEFLSTLNLDGVSGCGSSSGSGDRARLTTAINESTLSSAVGQVSKRFGSKCDLARLRRQITSLSSPHSALPFSIINHGNIRLEFLALKSGVGSTISVMLQGFSQSHVGSPLLDVFLFLIDCRNLAKLPVEEAAKTVAALLRSYQASFASTCGCLRVNPESLPLGQLNEDFATYSTPAIILLWLSRFCDSTGDTEPASEVPSSRCTLPQVCLEAIEKFDAIGRVISART